MRLGDMAERSFARHETFHPRYGWFRKAYAFAATDPYVFGREDAPVAIGVGKNMVRAIRFWGMAAKLIAKKSHKPRTSIVVPTLRGRALFGAHGWDPYMEDPGTLWLLHWLLLAPPTQLPVWWLAFNEFHAVEFVDADLEDAVITQLEAVATWNMPHPSSVRKDISALLRTYAPASGSRRTSIDDILDCPLRELNLLGSSAATNKYRFTLGPKPTLPSAIVAHAVLDYIDRTGTGGNTATISRFAHEAGAPGRVFKLTETELVAALQPMVERSRALSLAAPAGVAQLSWSEDPAAVATAILDDYYESTGTEACSGCLGDVPICDPDGAETDPMTSSRDAMSRARVASGVP